MVNKKVSVGKVEINFTNRSLYTLIAFFAILTFAVGVYAVGTTPNPGHPITQLQLCDDAGQILKMSGGAWTCGADEVGTGGGESLWSASGSNAIYRMGGRVGIGTSNPSQKLTISVAPGAPATSGSDQSGGSQIRLEQSGDNTVLDFGVIDGLGRGSWLQSTDKSDLATNYPLLLNPNGGKVGIGTTNPTSKFHVKGGNGALFELTDSPKVYITDFGVTGTSKVSFIKDNRGDISYSDGTGLMLAAGTGTSVPTITNGLRISTAGKVGIGGGPNPNAKLYVAGSVAVGSSYSALLAPENGAIIQGKVGIGTWNPDSKLNVDAGSDLYGMRVSMGSNKNLFVWTINNIVGLTSVDDDNTSGDIALTGKRIYFHTGEPLSGAPRMVLESNGDVKIANLAGTGNAYACVRNTGVLFRSTAPCEIAS